MAFTYEAEIRDTHANKRVISKRKEKKRSKKVRKQKQETIPKRIHGIMLIWVPI